MARILPATPAVVNTLPWPSRAGWLSLSRGAAASDSAMQSVLKPETTVSGVHCLTSRSGCSPNWPMLSSNHASRLVSQALRVSTSSSYEFGTL